LPGWAAGLNGYNGLGLAGVGIGVRSQRHIGHGWIV
jgi:hypothetical protein